MLNIAGRLCRSLGLRTLKWAWRAWKVKGRLPERKPRQRRAWDKAPPGGGGTAAGGPSAASTWGGTDIKLALALDGKLLAVKEYDWNPGSSPVAEGLIRPILLLAGLMQARLAAEALPEDSRERRLMERALEKNASHEQMEKAIKACSGNEPPRFSGIGLSFPRRGHPQPHPGRGDPQDQGHEGEPLSWIMRRSFQSSAVWAGNLRSCACPAAGWR